MHQSKESLESAWTTKIQGLERANTEAEQSLLMQNTRWHQTREAHERTLETLRAELSHVTSDWRTAERELEDLTTKYNELEAKAEALSDQLTNSQAECLRLSARCSALENSNAEHVSTVQESLQKLAAAREEADAVKKDYSALVEAGTAKDNALRLELAEVHRRAAANERAANDTLTQERRDHEEACAELRMEIFSLRQTGSDRDDELLRVEQQRDAAQSMLRIVQTELEASKAREIDALARVDNIMNDFSEETSALRSKVTELSTALKEAEDSRLNAGQAVNTLKTQLHQEQRTWQSKCWDLQKELQDCNDKLEEQRRAISLASSQAQLVIKDTDELRRGMRMMEGALNEEQYREKQLQRELYASKMQTEQLESRNKDLILRTSTELGSLRSEKDSLQKENLALVEEIGVRDADAGLAGFARGVEACQAEIKSQVSPSPAFCHSDFFLKSLTLRHLTG